MKGWLSTILFILCFTVSVPVLSFLRPLGGDKFEVMSLLPYLVLFVVVFHIANSIYLMFDHPRGNILAQAIVIQIAVFILQILVCVICIGATIGSLAFAQIFTLPVIWKVSIFVYLLLDLLAALRGIAHVVRLCQENRISTTEGFIHLVLQFFPLVNVIDCVVLRKK